MMSARRTTFLVALCCAVAVLLLDAMPAVAGTPSVIEHFGNIEFNDGSGFIKLLSNDHHSGSPVLSPDGRTVAWIHIEPGTRQAPDDPGQTSVWIADGRTGSSRRFLGDLSSRDMRNFVVNPQGLAFSLDGGFLYVTSQMGAISPGVHEVNVSTGQHKFVVEGALMKVVRTGPYRGFLIVGQHRYFDAPRMGSYDAAYLIRPDGHVETMIPRSDDQADAVDEWLKSKGWEAW
jgi:hypothetical protein